jgi:Predicted dehydrogenases and related proteins
MTSRREFLGAAAAVTATSRVLGANDRIGIGIIGVGGMGFGHVKMLKPRTDVRIVAVSDIYTARKQRARDFLGLTDKDVHHDYKDLLARPDVDAVFVVTPDHWHYRMAMDALEAGKEVYVQKPMAYKIEEAKAMAERVKKTGRVLQVGSQYASEAQYHRARELVAQGAIGKPLWAQGTYCRNTFHGEWNYEIDKEGTEENIDWKRFLGSAPKRPFSQDRYFRWRKYWDYSGGIATDLLYHRLVPFLVTLGPQFPVRVSSNGGIYVHKDREVPDTVSTTIEYPDFQIVMSSSMAADLPGSHIAPILYGHEGSIEFRGKELVVTPEPIYAKGGKQPQRISAETRELHVAHMENFFDCVRSRKKPNLDADFGYRAMVAIGLGVEAYRESKQLAFDPATERVLKSAPHRDAYEGNGKNVDETTPS